MNVYYINLLLILGLAYPLCLRRPSNIKKAAYLLVVFGFMWCLATFRYGIGFDYFTYLEIFENLNAFPSLRAAFASPYEPGFVVLNRLMGSVVHTPVGIYGVYAFLTFAPAAVAIYLYCDDAWLSCWLYVTLTYLYTGMSMIRQVLACSFVFLGYGFLRDRKPVPYFLLVLLGASFHKTALIMIPLYFLSMIPIGIKSLCVYGVGIGIVYLLSPWIMDVVTDYIFTYYKGTTWIEDGLSLRFLLVPTALLIICLALFPIWRQRDRAANLLTSMAVFSWACWLVLTRHFIVERLSHYPYMLMLIAVPAALSALKAPAEDYEALAALERSPGGKSKRDKQTQAQVRGLRQRIGDHQKYYWSAVAALLLITFLYHEYGQYVDGTNGFHNVFPYQSIFHQ